MYFVLTIGRQRTRTFCAKEQIVFIWRMLINCFASIAQMKCYTLQLMGSVAFVIHPLIKSNLT